MFKFKPELLFIYAISSYYTSSFPLNSDLREKIETYFNPNVQNSSLSSVISYFDSAPTWPGSATTDLTFLGYLPFDKVSSGYNYIPFRGISLTYSRDTSTNYITYMRYYCKRKFEKNTLYWYSLKEEKDYNDTITIQDGNMEY